MIDRRKFLEAGGAGLAALALLGGNKNAFAAESDQAVSSAPASSPSVSARKIFPLNRNWLYSPKQAAGATRPDFDDRRFERISIPHTNKVLPWHSFDEKDYQFVSIYRRHFKLPVNLRGQRVFVDFAGVMTAAKVYINGQSLGEYRGGYTPFSFELTQNLNWGGKDNVLAVEVDSTERADIPPFGGLMDYLTFGGIYREVKLRVVPQVYIENLFVKPVNVMQENRSVAVRVFPAGKIAGAKYKLTAELTDNGKIIAAAKETAVSNGDFTDLTIEIPGKIELWELDKPKLYRVRAKLFADERLIDEYETSTGFREAKFTPEGFYLNGRHVKLRGLNRHQTFPFIGAAAPDRVQKMDARILKKELKCNVVRTSHYPQSTHFLDACDELGLLVFEEIPGWQHVGDKGWQDTAVRNVEEMIRRDWNHPSIILWGVRINESQDNHDFYTRTNRVAHSLDDSRQTGGVRNKIESELLEDVFTMNDFYFPLKEPNHPLFLNTEFAGHMFPTKRTDSVERQTEHAIRHARVHNQIASSERYAGGLAWCAFDYNTHANFGSGDHVCYHGVADIFRIPKLAAGFYKSQCDPTEEIVLEPIFHWSEGDRSEGGGLRSAMIASNCERLKIYLNDKFQMEIKPNEKDFGHLKYPPFFTDIYHLYEVEKNDLRIDGLIGDKTVISKTLSGKSIDAGFHLLPDDAELVGDGIDTMRIVMKVTDEFGNPRPFATGAIILAVEGAGEIIGENPFALTGGVGAVWLRTKENNRAGEVIKISARHPVLGVKTAVIKIKPAAPEEI